MRYFPQALILLALALLSGCTTVGNNIHGIKNFAQVSPDLYRGAQPTPEGIQTLAKHNIKTVVNLRYTDEIDPQEAELVRKAGMHYVSLPHDASKATLKDAQDFLAILDQAAKPIFVHCHAGRDRTGLAIAAYRILIQQWTAKAAEKELYSYGHYWALYPKIARLVVAMGQRVPANALAKATEKASGKIRAATDPEPARN